MTRHGMTPADAIGSPVGSRRAERQAAREEAAVRLAETVRRKYPDRLPVAGYFVYLLWGTDDKRPLYIGQTGHLLQRLGWHYRNHGQDIKSVQLIECQSRETAVWLEERLIWTERPMHNSEWTEGFGEWTTGRRRPPKPQ